MPTDSKITDDQISTFTMDLATKVVAIADRVADAYVRKLDRDGDEGMLPGEYAANPAPAQIPLALRAKFRCASVSPGTMLDGATPNYVMAILQAVTAEDNTSWSKATPSGSLSLCIANPRAFDALVAGQDYYLDLTAVPPAPDAPTAYVVQNGDGTARLSPTPPAA